MELAEKLRRLRKAEGMRRGLWRTLTQHEVIRAMRQEIGASLSQAYLSQLENGSRVHLSSTTREALARFYHVHPGYLISDSAAFAGASALDGAHEASGASGASDLLTRMASASDPARVARLLDWLLRLPPEELAALERRMHAGGAGDGRSE